MAESNQRPATPRGNLTEAIGIRLVNDLNPGT